MGWSDQEEDTIGAGRAFGRGRPINDTVDDGWGSNADGDKQNNGWGGGGGDNRRGNRAGGGGGYRGGDRNGGGRRGGDDGGWGNSNGGGGRRGDDDGGWGNSNGGGRGGDRNGGGRRDGDDNSGGWGNSNGGGRSGGGRRGGDDDGGWGNGNSGSRGGDRNGGRRGNDDGGWGGDDKNNGDGGWGGGYKNDGGDRPRRRRDDEQNDGEEKKREIYVPKDKDENEIFDSGCATGINFSQYDNIDVKVSGENIPRKVESFEEAGLRTFLLGNIKRSGYAKPTPIQKYAIPIIAAGRDVMACAQTGSGKTAAFVLPILNKLLADLPDTLSSGEYVTPAAVIMAPTRELAIQISDECRKFSTGSSLLIGLLYGGTSVGYQMRNVVERGCHVLVATPGRFMDFINRGKVNLCNLQFAVLDEADRMLDMGFRSEMEKLLRHDQAPESKQTLMFSATFPEEIQILARNYLKDYLFITVGIIGGACADVVQNFIEVSRLEKRTELKKVLEENGVERTLVFVEAKRNCDFITTFLCGSQYKATSIHGDRLQREREEALESFKKGRADILVATAVAARGLDIKNVKHVINFDLPKEIDEYVHRIGRTGRVGNKGKATSFYDPSNDARLARDLIKILEQTQQEVPPFLERDVNASMGGEFSSSGFGGHDIRGESSMYNAREPHNSGGEDGW